jgi:phage terminase large subunit
MEEANKRTINLKPHQDELIFSEAPFPALGGGWGNGKTLAGCVKAWSLSSESPDNLGVIARKHFTDLRDSTLADFLALFGGMVRFSKSDMSATLANGSKILFRHADKLGSLTNLNLGWFWLDQAEEVTEDAFIFLRGRLRRKNAKRRQGVLTFNMEGHNWIWRTFLKNLDKDEQPLDPADYHLITADTLSNRDNLPEDYIRQILKLPERVRQRYVYGSWDVFEGQIYPMFSDQIHVIEPFSPPHDWTIFEMGDHGRTNPTSWHWGAVDFAGNLFIFDEHYLAGAPVSTHVEAIKKIRARHKLEPHELAYSVIDPNTRQEDSTGTTIQYQYLDAGLYPSDLQSRLFGGNNDVLAGINLVSEYLQWDPDRPHPLTKTKGSPRLFITRNCVNAIREFHEYQWQTLNNRSTALNAPEKPRKYNDHAMDDIRYGVMSVPKVPVKQEPTGTVEAMKTRYLEFVRAKQQDEQDPMGDYL